MYRLFSVQESKCDLSSICIFSVKKNIFLSVTCENIVVHLSAGISFLYLEGRIALMIRIKARHIYKHIYNM